MEICTGEGKKGAAWPRVRLGARWPRRSRWPSVLERWLELATGRCGSGSNPTAENFASELSQFHLPRFASVFRRRHSKPWVPSIWCLRQGEVKDPTTPHWNV